MYQDIGVLACMKKMETGEYIFCWHILGFISSTTSIPFKPNLLRKVYFPPILMVFISATKFSVQNRVSLRNRLIDKFYFILFATCICAYNILSDLVFICFEHCCNTVMIYMWFKSFSYLNWNKADFQSTKSLNIIWLPLKFFFWCVMHLKIFSLTHIKDLVISLNWFYFP